MGTQQDALDPVVYRVPPTPSPTPILPASTPFSSSSPLPALLPISPPTISSAVALRLYTSHLLSTYNSRSFQFAAILFLASIFPTTLLPLSIYALVCGFSAILFGPLVGRTVDRLARLGVVRFSVGKFVFSCLVFQGLKWVGEVSRRLKLGFKISED